MKQKATKAVGGASSAPRKSKSTGLRMAIFNVGRRGLTLRAAFEKQSMKTPVYPMQPDTTRKAIPTIPKQPSHHQGKAKALKAHTFFFRTSACEAKVLGASLAIGSHHGFGDSHCRQEMAVGRDGTGVA